VVYESRNSKQPGAVEIIDLLLQNTWYRKNTKKPDEEYQRIVNYLVLDRLIQLAANPRNAPQVRAIAELKLKELKERFYFSVEDVSLADNRMAMYVYGIKQIEFYQKYPDKVIIKQTSQIPQGAPIGSY